jgi:hypothetical protein
MPSGIRPPSEAERTEASGITARVRNMLIRVTKEKKLSTAPAKEARNTVSDRRPAVAVIR